MCMPVKINKEGGVGLHREVLNEQRWCVVSCGSFRGTVAPSQVSRRGLKAWAYPNRVMLNLSDIKSGSLAFTSTPFNWVPFVDQPLLLTTLRAQS